MNDLWVPKLQRMCVLQLFFEIPGRRLIHALLCITRHFITNVWCLIALLFCAGGNLGAIVPNTAAASAGGSSGKTFSGGAIAGIAIGCIVAGAVVAAAVVAVVMKRKAQQRDVEAILSAPANKL